MHKVRKVAMKLSYLILRKIVKIIATRGQILIQKCTKFDFGWGSAPHPAEGAYSASPYPWILGALLLREGTGEGRKREGRKRRERRVYGGPKGPYF